MEKGKVIIRIKDEYELQGGIGRIDLYWSNTGMRLSGCWKKAFFMAS